MIVKCYPIAYKDSLQEYNVILLYSMTWIIWYFTHNYIFCDASSHFIFYLSPKIGNYSLSLSLYIYIYIIYSFLQLYFRLMNHCIFFYNTILC